MKVAVIGSRTFNDYSLVAEVLDYQNELHGEWGITLISGGAKGADSLAERWANDNDISIEVIKPDYNKHGKLAPLIRNKDIINKAEQVIAFWDGQSSGTLHAIKEAARQGKIIIIQGFKHDSRTVSNTHKVTQ